MEVPGKTEHYLMQLAAEVRRVPSHVWGKNAHVDMNDLRIRFVEKVDEGGESKPAMTQEELRKQHAEWSKAAWHSRLGLDEHGQKPKYKTRDELIQEEAEALIAKDKAKRSAAGGSPAVLQTTMFAASRYEG